MGNPEGRQPTEADRESLPVSNENTQEVPRNPDSVEMALAHQPDEWWEVMGFNRIPESQRSKMRDEILGFVAQEKKRSKSWTPEGWALARAAMHPGENPDDKRGEVMDMMSSFLMASKTFHSSTYTGEASPIPIPPEAHYPMLNRMKATSTGIERMRTEATPEVAQEVERQFLQQQLDHYWGTYERRVEMLMARTFDTLRRVQDRPHTKLRDVHFLSADDGNEETHAAKAYYLQLGEKLKTDAEAILDNAQLTAEQAKREIDALFSPETFKKTQPASPDDRVYVDPHAYAIDYLTKPFEFDQFIEPNVE